MYEIITNIEIKASPTQVWHALTDFQSYPRWNPSIRTIEGTAAKGQKLKVLFQPDGAFGMKFSAVVIASVLEKEFRWMGCFLFPAIFSGEHYFLIQPFAPNCSKLIHGERFSGLLSPIMQRLLAERNKVAYSAMNHALKAYVESKI